jgi:flagellar biosynthetic protein FliR
MAVEGLSTAYFQGFFLAMVRAMAVMVSAPVLGYRSIPSLVKLGLAASLALLAAPGLSHDLAPKLFLLQVAQEAMVGLLLGLTVSLSFAAIQMAAGMVAVQMGFSLGGVLDPMLSAQGSTVERFYGLLAATVFFAVDGHHQMVLGLAQSFHLVPLGSSAMGLVALDRFTYLSAGMFASALRIALPLAGTLALVDVGLGLLGRAVPQLNLLLLGMPMKVLVGILLMAATMPLAVMAMDRTIMAGLSSMLQPFVVR